MSQQRIIGLTGPTGAGKSTAAEEFSALGAKVIDCDRLGQEILIHRSAVNSFAAHMEQRFWERMARFPGLNWQKKLFPHRGLRPSQRHYPPFDYAGNPGENLTVLFSGGVGCCN